MAQAPTAVGTARQTSPFQYRTLFNHIPPSYVTEPRCLGRRGAHGKQLYVPTQAEMCDAYLGVTPPESISLVLTADPGDFSGTPEAHHIISNLQNRHVKPRSESVCGGLYLGTLMGIDALVVTTGEAPGQERTHAV